MFSLLFVGAALAQDTDALTDNAAPRVQYKTVTEIEFDKLKIDGKLEGPEGTLTIETVRAEHPSLIRLRVSFDEELAQSTSEVR